MMNDEVIYFDLKTQLCVHFSEIKHEHLTLKYDCQRLLR